MNEPAKAYSRTWRPAPAPPSGGGPPKRRLRVAVVAATLLSVCGALIAWLLFLRPFHPAHFLPLCIGEYGEDYPVRPRVRQDAESLRALGWKESNAFTLQKRALLVQALRDCAGRQFDGPLVIYLSACARATAQGELCVLPVDAHLDRPDTWLPLREVFERLRASKAPHKLLLLDIMQPFTDARRGLLVNDAAERLQPLLADVLPKDPRLSVLCACSPGQTSVVAEELGHSAFAYFLREGLRGQADGENPRHHADGRVSLQELAAYVTTRVEQWTWRQRNVGQTPRLHGAPEDYPLVAVGSAPGPAEESPLETEYPDWLSAGWKLRDRWWDDESYRLAPETFRQLEAALLRAEQQWRGGVGIERARADLTARRERLERQRAKRLPTTASVPDSLARATAGGRKLPKLADAETIRAVAQLAARHGRATAGRRDEAALQKLATEVEQLLKKFAGQPLALAWVVFAATEADAPTPAALSFLSGLLQQARVPAYAETRLLTRLAELPAAAPQDWPAESIGLALRMVWEAEKAAAGDARALPWVRVLRAGADRLRIQGETLLADRDPAQRRRIAEVLRAALQAYQAINRDLHTVEEAQRCRDEMMVLLPSYVAYLEIDDSSEQAWSEALTTTRELRQALAAPVAPPGPARDAQLRQLAELTAALWNDPNGLNSLRRPLERGPFDKLLGRREVGDFADVKVMTALLEVPWPRADQRAKLWAARQELLGVLLRRQRSETSVPAWDEARGIAAQRRHALQRGGRSLALLQLEGVSSTAKVEMAFARASEGPADAVRLWVLGEELRRAWAHRAELAARSGERGASAP